MDAVHTAMSLIAFSRELAEQELNGEIRRSQAIGKIYQAGVEASNHGVDWRWALEFYKSALGDAREARSAEALLGMAMSRGHTAVEEPDAS